MTGDDVHLGDDGIDGWEFHAYSQFDYSNTKWLKEQAHDPIGRAYHDHEVTCRTGLCILRVVSRLRSERSS